MVNGATDPPPHPGNTDPEASVLRVGWADAKSSDKSTGTLWRVPEEHWSPAFHHSELPQICTLGFGATGDTLQGVLAGEPGMFSEASRGVFFPPVLDESSEGGA